MGGGHVSVSVSAAGRVLANGGVVEGCVVAVPSSLVRFRRLHRAIRVFFGGGGVGDRSW